jgi:hypothetical protein
MNASKLNETQPQYRARLASQKKAAKARAAGRVLWNSARHGTYVTAKHGAL